MCPMDRFSAVVTTGIYCRPGCGAQPLAQNVQLVPARGLGRGRRLPGLHALPPVPLAAVRLLDGSGARLPGRAPGPGRRARQRERGRPRRTPRRLGPAPAPPLQGAAGRDAGRAGTLGPGPLRAAAPRRHRPDRDPDRARGGVRQPAPVQPRLPRRLPRVAPRAAGPPPQGGSSRRRRRPAPAPRVPRPARLAGPGRVLLRPRHSRRRGRRRRHLPANDRRPRQARRARARPGGDDHLLLRAHLPNWDELVHVVQRARRIGSLDFDLSEPAVHLAGDPTIGPLLDARPGLRPPGTWDPFETGVRAIIGQQVTLAGANTIAGRLVARLGTSVPGLEPLGLTHTFPSAAVLARGNLDGLGLTPPRARAVRAVRRARSSKTPSCSTVASAWTGSSPRSRRSTVSGRGRRTTSPCDWRAGRVSDQRSGASTRSPPQGSYGRGARRPGRTLAAVASPGGDPSLDRRRPARARAQHSAGRGVAARAGALLPLWPDADRLSGR